MQDENQCVPTHKWRFVVFLFGFFGCNKTAMRERDESVLKSQEESTRDCKNID